MSKKIVVIIGAGPAGLTAAYELAKTGNYSPIVIEKLEIPGGLSRTINYKGNRIDIGGHRFFSKSDKIMEWWLKFLPLQNGIKKHIKIKYHNKSFEIPPTASSNDTEENVMLIRNRRSRIFFLNHFFSYPVKLNSDTLIKLGFTRSLHILLSFFYTKLKAPTQEKTLKDFFINRFGEQLYKTFFESYTLKVWGTEADKIPAEWGRQRIKGVTIFSVIANILRKKKKDDVSQKNIETSFIEKFLYPKYGPGQLWEKVANEIIACGGTIHYSHDVKSLCTDDDRMLCITATNRENETMVEFKGDYFISTMAIKDLVKGLKPAPANNLLHLASMLEYRDFITVGLLAKKLSHSEKNGELIKDNWIYIQEKDVKLGRLQIFNNWSPWMVKDPNTVWLGLEYFCKEGDEIWQMNSEELLALAEKELIKIGLIEPGVTIDGTVIKVEKAYPCYFGAYDKIDTLRSNLEKYKNLFLIGRNGMHKYNNQDHSMLTAMEAVKKIITGDTDKSTIWAINTESIYHEEK